MKRRVVRWFAGILVAVVICVFCLPYLFAVVPGLIWPDIAFRFPAKSRVLYLTIDDAPSANTPQILAVLERHKVQATFFVIGSWAKSEDQLQQIVAHGHQLGHHMWTTKACSKMEIAEFMRDFDETARLLRPYSARYFRPASGLVRHEQVLRARQQGYTTTLGTVFPFDTTFSSPWLLSAIAEWLAVPGGIIIMHDGRIRGATTAETLDRLIPSLKRRGFEFRPLPLVRPNQSPEQTAPAVTDRAGERSAPAGGVAHL